MKFIALRKFLGLEVIEDLTPSEQEVFDIVTKMCYHSDSNLLIAPDSGKYFVENTKFNYFVVITLTTIRITNHKFDREIPMALYHLESLIEIFIKKVEEDRSKMELEMFGNSLIMLQSISKSLDQKENE